MQLYTGMRTKQCRLIRRLPCRAVEPIRLVFGLGVEEVSVGGVILRGAGRLDIFAVFDGFGDFGDMRAFWREEHVGLAMGPFSGVHIRWLDLPAELQVAA